MSSPFALVFSLEEKYIQLFIVIFIVALLLLFSLIQKFRNRNKNFEKEDKVEILLLLNKNDKDLIKHFNKKYANENLNFISYSFPEDVNEDDPTFVSVVLNNLPILDGVLFYWWNGIQNSHLKVLRQIANKINTIPIIIVESEESETDDRFLEFKGTYNFKSIDRETSLTNLWILLVRSIEREHIRYKTSEFWKLTTVVSLIFLGMITISLGVFTYNENMENKLPSLNEQAVITLLETNRKFNDIDRSLNGFYDTLVDTRLTNESKSKLKNSIESYLRFTSLELESYLGKDVGTKVSLWRTLGSNKVRDVLSEPSQYFEFDLSNNSIIGCASLYPNNFILWKENNTIDETSIWDISNKRKGVFAGENKIVFKDSADCTCSFAKTDPISSTKKKGILCLAVKCTNGSVNGVCIDVSKNETVLEDHWVRQYLLKLALITSHIPDAVFR